MGKVFTKINIYEERVATRKPSEPETTPELTKCLDSRLFFVAGLDVVAPVKEVSFRSRRK